MPVRFNCSECQTLLSVGRRKIGETIDCPKCGRKLTVPDTDAVSGTKVEKRIPRSERRAGEGDAAAPTEESANSAVAAPVAPAPDPVGEDYYADVEFIIYEDEEDEPRAPTAPVGPPLLRPVEGPPADHVVIPRSLWNLTLTAFVVVSAGAFFLGFWLGGMNAAPRRATPQGTATEGEGATPAGEQPVVQGQAHYRSAPGLLSGDAGAVVLAVPHDNPPDAKIPAAGLRPEAASDRRAAALAALAAAGGGFQEVVADGSYLLTLPAPGRYRLVVVSNHAVRSGRPGAEAAVLALYFDSADELLRDKQFRILPLDARTGLVRAPACEFGT